MSRCVGFTLIESLVVIAIIGIVSSLLFALVALANDRAVKAQNISLLQKIHAGLCDYSIIYNSFPPTHQEPLRFNGIAYYLCSPSEEVFPKKRNSGVLIGEIAERYIKDDELVDAYGQGSSFVYLYTKPGVEEEREKIDSPDVLMSDDTDWTLTVYREWYAEFELWSKGEDGQAGESRCDERNRDNVSVTSPYGEMGVF